VLSLSLLVVARGASAACGWFGFALNTAATFDVFCGLQVTNYGVLNVLLESTPNRLDYMDVWVLSIHVQTASAITSWQPFSDESGGEQAEKRAGAPQILQTAQDIPKTSDELKNR